MFSSLDARRVCFVSILFILSALWSAVPAQRRPNDSDGLPVIWKDPGNIARRDLRFGPGSAKLRPSPPFTFVKEEITGESPKFNVSDAKGVNWSVKLGPESQSETVATRLVWAVGYFAEEAYFYPSVEITGLPKLSRGERFFQGNTVFEARFEPRRSNVVRGPTWKWLSNPFIGTREFNGLKTMMALLANYDTSTDNNRILTVEDEDSGKTEHRYVVTDLGATFGSVGGLGGDRSKNDLSDYSSARFIKRVKDDMVEFDYRTRPAKLGHFAFVFNPRYWKSQTDKEKAIKDIPISDARWIGQKLSQLTNSQLRDAFEAANYSNAHVEGFIKALRKRISELASLTTPDRSRPGSKPVEKKS